MLTVLVLLIAADTPTPLLPNVEGGDSCKVCHARIALERSLHDKAHADLSCAECHTGKSFNPHSAGADAPSAEDVAQLAGYAKHSPGTYLVCEECHEEQVLAWRTSAHGPDGASRKGEHPACGACHGSMHAVRKGIDKIAAADRCVACHNFADAGKVPTSRFVVDTYRDTVHGRMLRLGNKNAAACADCHGTHDVFAATHTRSHVHATQRAATCGKCHEGADARFAMVLSHVPRHIDRDFWGGIITLFYAFLTLLVIGALLVHAVLDFARAAISALRAKPEPASAAGPVPADAPVARFDTHMRVQHLGMLISFTLLVVTGWPLQTARVSASATLVHLLGGQAVLALVHRSAGVLLLAVSLYHLVYLARRWRRGTLSLDMLPALRDARDLWGNLAYFVGLRKERPRFARWTYFEKMEYWAVVWGTAVMAVTGIVMWLPVAASRILPAKLIDLALLLHSLEALLALLAIFLWHFYNVHLRPTIFPMSWVWLTGKISALDLYHEHRDEYERVFKTTLPPQSPGVPRTWHQKPVWSFAALGIIALSAGLMAYANIATLEHEVLFQLRARPTKADANVTIAGPLDVYDAGFKVFETCFSCHNRQHADLPASGFPHKQHFEDEDVSSDCAVCHKSTWHERMTTSTELCMECHEPEEIGVPAAD